MTEEEITFFNQSIKLSGTLYKPKNAQLYPVVVVVHPASEAERTAAFYDHLKSELPQHGFAVLVFDRRGSGASDGNFETADFEDLAGDVVTAVKYLQSRSDVDKARIGLHGTSQGAWIAPIAAARKPDIAFVVAVSASGVSPANQMDYGVAFHLKQAGFDQTIIDKVIRLRNLVNEYFRGQVTREVVAAELRTFESEPWFENGYLYPSQELPVDITQSKWHYEMDYEPLSIWQEVKQPALFLFAEIDEWVPIEKSMVNYKNATSHLQDVTLIQVNGVDHMLRYLSGEHKAEISTEYIDILVKWLTTRYL